MPIAAYLQVPIPFCRRNESRMFSPFSRLGTSVTYNCKTTLAFSDLSAVLPCLFSYLSAVLPCRIAQFQLSSATDTEKFSKPQLVLFTLSALISKAHNVQKLSSGASDLLCQLHQMLRNYYPSFIRFARNMELDGSVCCHYKN
jgi:hypothetical protein